VSNTNDRMEVVEIVARGICGHNTPCEACRLSAERALTAIESSGRRIVPVERMVDYFAEIEAAITSIQGALRHYKQPQDVHFHFALKACRDGVAMLSASPKVTP